MTLFRVALFLATGPLASAMVDGAAANAPRRDAEPLPASAARRKAAPMVLRPPTDGSV